MVDINVAPLRKDPPSVMLRVSARFAELVKREAEQHQTTGVEITRAITTALWPSEDA